MKQATGYLGENRLLLHCLKHGIQVGTEFGLERKIGPEKTR